MVAYRGKDCKNPGLLVQQSNLFCPVESCFIDRVQIGQWNQSGWCQVPIFFKIHQRPIVAGSGVGCFIGDQCVNILAYANDLVFLAPSWHALQQLLLNILNEQCCLSDLTCNARKTVCMICVPKNRHRMLSTNFPSFKIGSYDLQFVSHFKYLGHSITSSLSDDDDRYTERNTFNVCTL